MINILRMMPKGIPNNNCESFFMIETFQTSDLTSDISGGYLDDYEHHEKHLG